MFIEELEHIDRLQHEYGKVSRRDTSMVYERNKKESLIEAREDLVDKIVSYRNGIEDETFAQGGRRQRYDSILEDQREALEELTEDDTAVTIGDMATVEEI